MVSRAVVRVAFLFGLASSLIAQQDSVTAITDINVVDVVRGEVLYGQTLVIANGRIEAVGAASSVQIPPKAVRIAGEGRYAMPGLWDMHIHLRGDQKNPSVRLADENAELLDLFLPNGVVGVREMGGDLSDEVIRWREEIRAGKRTGPRIITAGRKIDQDPPSWAGSLSVKSVVDARESVRQVKQSGADFVKVYFNDVKPEVLKATIDEAHKLGLKVTGHKPVNISIQEFVDMGIDGMEHSQYLPATDREEYDRFASDREKRKETKWPMEGPETVARLLAMEDKKQSELEYKRMAEKQFWVTPTLAVFAHDLENGVRDYEADARKRFFFPAIWASWDPKLGLRKPLTGHPLELRTISINHWREATLSAHKAGVPMLLGTDSGANNTHTMPGWAIHEELAELVKAGLTPAEALRMATVNAARWRGEAATEGTVEKGKVADVLILRSNPLEAIRHTEEVDSVFKAGRRYSRADLDGMLAQAENKVANARRRPGETRTQ